MKKDALIILTGVTADSSKRSYVLDYFRANTEYEVFLPRLWQFFGILGAARQLSWLFKLKNIERFPRCHFICYISGGFILRQALSFKPLSNLGRIVYVRSPFQERVPELAIKKLGPLMALLSNGKMLFDLASAHKDKLPVISTEDGVILETGVSDFAAQLGIKHEDFETYRYSKAFCLPPARETITTELSHDQVYTSDTLFDVMTGFLNTGSFSAASPIH